MNRNSSASVGSGSTSSNNNSADQSSSESNQETILSPLTSSTSSSNSNSAPSIVTSMPTTTDESGQSTSVDKGAEVIDSASSDVTDSINNEITIKLKYLNDDLKIVKAKTNEPIGDFKKYAPFRKFFFSPLKKSFRKIILMFIFLTDEISMKS